MLIIMMKMIPMNLVSDPGGIRNIGCQMEAYADRDIHVGEERLIDHEFSAVNHKRYF